MVPPQLPTISAVPRLQGFIRASHAWHLPLCTTGKKPPGHSDTETRGPQKPWWNDVKGSSAFSVIHMRTQQTCIGLYKWVTNAFTSPCYQHKRNKTNEKRPKFNPFQQLVAHLAERIQSFLDVIKIFWGGRCLQISFQQTTQGLLSSLATEGLLSFTPRQATLPTRFKNGNHWNLPRLSSLASRTQFLQQPAQLFGGWALGVKGCQSTLVFCWATKCTSKLLWFTSPSFGPWKNFQPKVSEQSEALAVFSSASNFSRCALRRSMLHKEILDILEI